MPPITAAASARSRIAGPSTVPIGSPTMPARRNTDEEREHRRDHPHERLEPAHGDAEQRGAVGVLGGAAHRHADARPQEQREQRAHERHRDRGDHLVAAEAHEADGERRVDRRREALRWRGHVEPAGEQQPDPRQHLRETDGGDAQDEARRAEEAPDHHQLDDRAQQHRRPRCR